MLRSILAVVAGYVALAALTVIADLAVGAAFPETFRPDAEEIQAGAGLLLLTLAYSFAFAVVGGYVAAAVATRSELKHALALGIVLLAFGIMTMFAYAGRQPLWFQISLAALGLPGALLGGLLRLRKKQKTADRSSGTR